MSKIARRVQLKYDKYEGDLLWVDVIKEILDDREDKHWYVYDGKIHVGD